MEYNNILVEKNQAIAVVTINRPTKLNALNKETIAELHTVFSTLNNDKGTRVIIITGSGEKSFVAGADISEFASFKPEQGAELARKGQETLFDFIENMSKPVIAAVNGFALGGGLELAMATHFRVASDNAKMGLPEVTLGLIPGYGGTQRLAQLIGKGKAMELIMTAQMIDAATALQLGLVNYVVSQAELIDFAIGLAEKIVKNSPNAIKEAIACINAGFKEGVNGFEVEIKRFGDCFQTADFIEGTTAFLEKRKPVF
ncbi:enoyl-CoA hydratase/isomerase family protein [Capnocytophaga sp. ARDL2]|uniref:enoyl-CoA hydratase/isomerase family protein n=1 Tax=Capnocytophaga sp. ARDL2 TaxID=3238809 RepID=UPI0035588B73